MSGINGKPSYWHNPGKIPLSYFTLGQIVDQAAEKWGENEAFINIYQNHRLTFKEARDKADHLAAGLLQLGINPGDRLGIWSHNSTEWYITRLAAAKAGLIIVQLDPAYQAPQLLYGLNKVDIKVLIFSEFYKEHNCYSIFKNVIPELNSLQNCGCEINNVKVPSLKRVIITSETQYPGTYRFSDVMKSAKPETLTKIREIQMDIQSDEPCAIQFSSGTTGTPKAAVLSHHNLVNNGLIFQSRLERIPGVSKNMVTTQFCHTSGSLGGIILGMCCGISMVITAPVFDAKSILDGIIKEKCTHILATPSLYVALVTTAQDLGIKPTSLEVASYGGAPCSQQLVLQMRETLNIRRLSPAYGMTEISIVFSSLQGDSIEQVLNTVGYVGEHLEVKVVDKEGRMVPMGIPGELHVRGYSVMLGYWDDEERTRQFVSPDRWAKTGDQFVLQEDGYGRIVGRVKDMIIRIADNIFPVEIEDFFLEHPDILEAQAFGVPDPKVGEEICVYLRLREGKSMTEKYLRDYCKDKLPEYRIPRYIRFVKDFERTVIGKIARFRLLEQLLKELDIADKNKN